MVISFQGAHGPKEIMLTVVRWSVAYPLRTRRDEALVVFQICTCTIICVRACLKSRLRGR
jgi:hypothetical protein